MWKGRQNEHGFIIYILSTRVDISTDAQSLITTDFQPAAQDRS